MKQQYTELELATIEFDAEDVITASDDSCNQNFTCDNTPQ